MATVWMGNTLARDPYHVPEDPNDPHNDRMVRKERLLAGKRVFHYTSPHDWPLMAVVVDITNPRGAWAAHSAEKPAWVVSEEPALEQLLAQHYGCPAGLPSDPEWRRAAAHPGIGLIDHVERTAHAAGA